MRKLYTFRNPNFRLFSRNIKAKSTACLALLFLLSGLMISSVADAQRTGRKREIPVADKTIVVSTPLDEMQRESAKQKAIKNGVYQPVNSNRNSIGQNTTSGVPSQNALLTFSGTLSVADPTFNRTLSMAQGGTCGLSAVGTAVHYKTHTFTVPVTGNVTVSLLASDGGSVTPGTADTFLELYGPAGFVPAAACTNLVAANDDAAGGGLISQILTTALPAGNYTAVVTSFDNTPTDFPWNYTLAVIVPNAVVANDNCSGATSLTPGPVCVPTAGTNVGATQSIAPITCASFTSSSALDVWYSFVATSTTHTITVVGAGSFDAVVDLRSGACNGTNIACADATTGGGTEVINATGLTIGATYFVRVYGWAGGTGNFTICVTAPVASCTGVPSPGAITPATSSVCAGTVVNLTLSGYTSGTGISIQWKSSPTPGGPYTNIAGATNPVYSFTAAATAYYVATVTCSNGGGNGTTAEVVVNVGAPTHSSLTATPSTTCSPGSTVIAATATGGIGNYTHTLTGPGIIGAPVVSGPNNSSVSFSVTSIPAGVNTYTLTSTDGIGCSKVSTISVTVNQTPLITMSTTPAFPNYLVTSSTGNTIVPGTTLVPGSRGDDVTASILLPFVYMAYGSSYTSVRVSSNGNIQFTGSGNTAFGNTCPLPTGTNLGFPAFMPHWDDLLTNVVPGDGIFTSVSGTAPNRIFNIEWRGSLFIGGTVNFEARLYEGQQRVDFIYGNMTNNGSSATIGVQGAISPTTLFTGYSCNTAALSSGLGLSFVMSPVNICIGSTVRIDASSIPTGTQSFSNSLNTHIPAGGTTSGVGSPYPSTIAVSGLLTSGVSVKSVTINNYNHTFPDDVDLVLVSPTGQAVILMSDCGGSTPATGQTFTFDDAAATNLADAAFNASGTYKCTNYGAGDNWPAPGPGTSPSSTTLSTFTGNMNGTWNLFAYDDTGGDIGLISTWSITFNVPQGVVFSPLTNLFNDAGATIPYTGTPAYTVWAKPTVSTTYTMTATAAGCTNTAPVQIAVNTPPAITVQPAAPAAPVCPGFNVNISVTATGSLLTYQWQRSTDNGTTWVNVVDDIVTHMGTTTSTLTVVNPSVAQNGHRYRVIINGFCTPAVTSNSTTLVIATPPTITTQPANVTTCVGLNATFSVVPGGVPAPNIFQWQVSTNGGVTYTNLTTGGSYTTTLTLTSVTAAMSGNRYRVIITNSCGQTITSNAGILTVNTPSIVAITPITQRVCLTDTLVPLVATPVGGSWSGIGVSGTNFVPPITAVGTYTLTYTYVNAAGCTSTGTTPVTVVDCPERLRELDENAVILFPNPNNGRFNIRVNSDLYNYLGMKVYTNDGRLVRTQVLSGLVYGRVIPIDLSNLPAAAYMVKFFYDNGVRTNEKTFTVIIQRK
ncbi:MAG: DVUA0089 family protein [Chitinophagaceae bacterium]